jgi:hypothetical protein
LQTGQQGACLFKLGNLGVNFENQVGYVHGDYSPVPRYSTGVWLGVCVSAFSSWLSKVNLGVFMFSVADALVSLGRTLPQWSIPLRPLEAAELQT